MTKKLENTDGNKTPIITARSIRSTSWKSENLSDLDFDKLFSTFRFVPLKKYEAALELKEAGDKAPWNKLKDGASMALVTLKNENIGRKKANIKSIVGFPYDFDKGAADYNEVLQALTTSGTAAHIYTSFSHTKDKHAFRVMILFATPIILNGTGDENDKRVNELYKLVAGHIGLPATFDTTSKDLNRASYLPTGAKGLEHRCDKIEGVRVDPNILAVQHDIVSKDEVDGVDIRVLLEQGQQRFKPDLFLSECAPDLIVGNREAGGVLINCPNNHDTGGAFADSARDGHPPQIHCMHNTCEKSGVDSIERLIIVLRSPDHPLATVEALIRSEYGITEYPALPKPYFYRQGAVWKTEDEEIVPVCSYIGFGSMVSPADSASWHTEIEVEGFDGKRSTILMSRGALSDKKTWSVTLREAGLRFYGKDSVVADLLERARPTVFKTLVTKMGWNDGVYILPTSNGEHVAIGANEKQEYVTKFDRVNNKFGSSGTLKTWKKDVASLCAGNDRLIFGLCAALSAPLLKPLNGDNVALNFCGASSKGKTTILDVAGSVYGRKFYTTWNATDNSLEGVFESNNDCITCLDETGQAKPEHLKSIPYLFGNSEGKDRANRQGGAGNTTKSFRGVLLSTGEKDYKELMEKIRVEVMAGEEQRWIDIIANADPETGVFQNLHAVKGATPKEKGHNFAQLLKRNSVKSYGVAGAAFINWFLQQDSAAFRTDLHERLKEFESRAVPKDAGGQIFRMAGKFAIIALAGELAIEAGILPYKKGACDAVCVSMFHDWTVQRGTLGDSETKSGFKSFFKTISKHGDSRFQDLNSVVEMPNNRLGFREDVTRDDNSIRIYYIEKQRIGDVITEGNVTTTLKRLSDEGFIVDPEPKRLTRRKTLPGLGRVHCYHISIPFGGDAIENTVGAWKKNNE